MRSLYCPCLLLLAGLPAWSQVSKPTADEAQISVYDIPGGGAFRTTGLSKAPGLADPRDFTGTWNTQGNPGQLANFLQLRSRQAEQARNERVGGAVAGAPSSSPAPGGNAGPEAARGGGPPGNGPGGPGGPGGGANASYKNACMPTVGVAAGGDGPVEIVQTADQLTWMAEEMHAIRRIFLKGTFTPNLPTSYLGESVGHFEGDVLVVETRGIKSLNGRRMIERISKSDEGRVLHNEVSYVDADGKASGNKREIALYYRPNERMLEWICEDNGQVYQTGVNGKLL
jgi:hypothetical protein